MTTEPLVLAVDDEPGILRLLKLELTAQGFRLITASGGEEALQLVEEQRPDLVLLDIIMPDMTGLEVMRRIREVSNVPIMLITAKDTDADKVQGLGLGADDYVVKPFNPEEVAARIAAVLRRSIGPQTVDRVITIDDLEIDLNRRLVFRGGIVVSLTRTEWLLLQHLAANAGRVMLNAELLSKVWGPEYRDDLQYLRVWVSRLRRKLEADVSVGGRSRDRRLQLESAEEHCPQWRGAHILTPRSTSPVSCSLTELGRRLGCFRCRAAVAAEPARSMTNCRCCRPTAAPPAARCR